MIARQELNMIRLVAQKLKSGKEPYNHVNPKYQHSHARMGSSDGMDTCLPPAFPILKSDYSMFEGMQRKNHNTLGVAWFISILLVVL